MANAAATVRGPLLADSGAWINVGGRRIACARDCRRTQSPGGGLLLSECQVVTRQNRAVSLHCDPPVESRRRLAMVVTAFCESFWTSDFSRLAGSSEADALPASEWHALHALIDDQVPDDTRNLIKLHFDAGRWPRRAVLRAGDEMEIEFDPASGRIQHVRNQPPKL